jgi:chromatin remodeling complex protein RSC6
MPKKTVSKTATETEQVVAPVVDVAATAAATEKKSRKPKAVKTEAAVESTPAPVVETATTTTSGDAAPAADAEAPLAEQSVEFLAKLQQLGTLINSIKSEYKALEKKWSREVKTAQKQSSKRKRKAGNRAPSGFVKPTKISDELASFLGKEKGSEMARTDVTREINTYIRAHKLQDSTNGRKINPDKKLAALLKLKTTDELTYFNLQKYMSPHFAKATKETTSA